LLLFVFVWDLGFEVLAPLHFHHTKSSAAVSVEPAEPEHHPDCGLPDHSCALSHHHHFPALISSAHTIILAVATEQILSTLPISALHRSTATRLIRGPPSLLPLPNFA
jgi:hypothetical protein